MYNLVLCWQTYGTRAGNGTQNHPVRNEASLSPLPHSCAHTCTVTHVAKPGRAVFHHPCGSRHLNVRVHIACMHDGQLFVWRMSMPETGCSGTGLCMRDGPPLFQVSALPRTQRPAGPRSPGGMVLRAISST